ncbi:unnamed protein product [Adineta steineri]|uniref:Uncharacterized protein n=1 Tax=Adineta steineri TaxID=433720 RepID=A0A816E4I3_9BILA|nr:unnamed protein product [Adineta steineri]CAF1647608.1 unnamed protein product [Adineta steineri]
MPSSNNSQWFGDSDELMSRSTFFGLACHHTRKLDSGMELHTATLTYSILKSAHYVNDMTVLSLFAVRSSFDRIYSWILTLTNGFQITNTTGAGLLSLGWRQCTFMWATLSANQYIESNFAIDSSSDSYGSKRMDVVVWWPEASTQTEKSSKCCTCSSKHTSTSMAKN